MLTTAGPVSGRWTRAISKALATTIAMTAVRTSSPLVALTFDDGPDDHVTPRLLELLRAREVHATFFVLGTRVDRFPSILTEVVSEGHEVALHGADHRRASEFSGRQIHERTMRARAAVEDRIGGPIKLIRPPYGEQTVRWARSMRALGLRTVLWGPSTRDTEHVSSETRLASATSGVTAGSILLAHDGFADAGDGASDGPRPVLDEIGLIGEIIDRYLDVGLSCTSVGALLDRS